MADNNQFLSNILAELQSLRKEVSDLKGSQASSKPGRKSTPKPKDPNAPPKPPNSWIVFSGKVRKALADAKLPAGIQAQQFASHLKNTYEDAYDWDADAIVAAHADWTPPPPKPKEAKPEGADPKPKRTITPEHLAKMQAGRKAAAEARKAAEDASKAAQSVAPVVDASPPSPKVASPPPSPSKLMPFPFKGKRLLLDPSTNGTWLRGPDNEDGTPQKGAWHGILSADRKSVDTSAADPNA